MKPEQPTPAETSRIPTEGAGAVVGALAYLATCAYPASWQKRDKFIDAGKRWLKWEHRRHGNAGDEVPRAIRQTLDAALTRLKKRRAIAAQLVQGYLITRGDARLTELMQPFLRLSGPQPTIRDDRYMRRDVWKESRPVLHLLLAYQQVKPGSDLFDVITHPDWLPDALEHAERSRQLLTWTGPYAAHECPWKGAFPIPVAETIQLLPE